MLSHQFVTGKANAGKNIRQPTVQSINESFSVGFATGIRHWRLIEGGTTVLRAYSTKCIGTVMYRTVSTYFIHMFETYVHTKYGCSTGSHQGAH
jgi:hypothetical protein